MSNVTVVWRRRLARLNRICGTTKVIGAGRASEIPFVAVTSSRLGRDAHLHWQICQFLRRTVMDCKQRGCDLLVASGSAIEPWAERAAELYGVPCRRLEVTEVHPQPYLIVRQGRSVPISVDAAVIALADRVDAVYARRGGLVAACLRRRLKTEQDASVRIAITKTDKCAAHELMNQGAIGWLDFGVAFAESRQTELRRPNKEIIIDARHENRWCRSESDWLIHCTRGRVGQWPDETERQYRDSMLLGNVSSAGRGPLDALLRIVRSGRIVASAKTSKHRYPVVCFSALSLQQLLAGRCFRPHLGRWDYEPYGIAIRASTAREQGVQPVIYGDEGDRDKLTDGDQFRFHPSGNTYDWRSEKEWRSPRSLDLRSLHRSDVRVFALDSEAARLALRDCPWPVSFLSSVDCLDPAV